MRYGFGRANFLPGQEPGLRNRFAARRESVPAGLRVCHSRAFSEHRPGSFGSSRSGFTLVEMLLVLGVLLAFSAMTVPPVLRLYSQRKLTESAERVRAVAASARVRAIDSGLIYQFCFETNGRHFVVVPFEPDHATGGQSGSGGGVVQNSPVTMSSRVWGELPKGVVFSSVIYGAAANPAMANNPSLMNSMPMSPNSMTATAHKIAPSFLEGLPNGGALSGMSWSQPILYNADGSANTDAEVTITDDRSQQITLRFRAFTGAVSMQRLTVGKRK